MLIRDAHEAIAYFTAAMAAAARGAPQAARWDDAGADALEDLLLRATQREQHSGTAPPPVYLAPGLRPDRLSDTRRECRGAENNSQGEGREMALAITHYETSMPAETISTSSAR